MTIQLLGGIFKSVFLLSSNLSILYFFLLVCHDSTGNLQIMTIGVKLFVDFSNNSWERCELSYIHIMRTLILSPNADNFMVSLNNYFTIERNGVT